MWNTNNWLNYEVLDTSNGEKLERFGEYILIVFDPQVIWNTEKLHEGRRKNAHYHRSSKGGEWEFFKLAGNMDSGL